MACLLFSTKPYINQCWVIVKWTLGNKLQWNLNQNTKFFIHENASEYIVCKMATILSRGRWVNRSPAHGVIYGINRSHPHTQYWQIPSPTGIFYKLFAWIDQACPVHSDKQFIENASSWLLLRSLIDDYEDIHVTETKPKTTACADHEMACSWKPKSMALTVSMWSILVSPITRINDMPEDNVLIIRQISIPSSDSNRSTSKAPVPLSRIVVRINANDIACEWRRFFP